MKKYITVKDEFGNIRPLSVLWPSGTEGHGHTTQEIYQPEIDKYMKKASKDGLVLVEVQIIEVEKSK